MFEDEAYFDFEEKQELPEELDFNRTKICPHCKKPIPADSTLCLYCGESVYYGEGKSKWMIWVAIIVIIAFLVLILF